MYELIQSGIELMRLVMVACEIFCIVQTIFQRADPLLLEDTDSLNAGAAPSDPRYVQLVIDLVI
jgi:hypothetical protein